MRIKKTNSAHYPVTAVLSDGRKLKIPRQAAFADEYIRKHGCSLVAEFIALEYIGARRTLHQLKRWNFKNTPNYVHPKTTVWAVWAYLSNMWDVLASSVYYRIVTPLRIRRAMEAGNMVIMEQGPPGTKVIHTIALIPDKGRCYCASHGKVVEVDVDKIAKTATNREKYRGMIIVKPRRVK